MKSEAHWTPLGRRMHHGIALPLSALRSKTSLGIGDFFDLFPFIDFCKRIGFDTIQLLPINDTGGDQSPYYAISSCALDPIYLSLASLPNIESLADEFISFKELNDLEQIKIFEVKQKKIAWAYRYFHQVFPTLCKEKKYLDFVQKNLSWLDPYARFKCLKKQYQGTHWMHWPSTGEILDDREFHYFLQYLCFTQMEEVRAYADKQGCFLQGDVPILISPDSADVWANPDLFLLDLSAGSPPDYYNLEGQKWGFPIFNWEVMRKSGFSWWKRRLKTIENLYHIYRIDHVIGFFRIWAIPKDLDANQGFFLPQDKNLWEKQGREILEMMLENSPLLPIAEDLGTLPAGIGPLLKELGICSTKVIRWQRRWENGKEYIPRNEYEPFSVTTVSTHDSETLEMWWRLYPDDAKIFAEEKHWDYNGTLSQEERFLFLMDAHHSASYFHINLLNEYLALFPDLVSPNPEKERINVPGTILSSNWTYRMRPLIEDLLQHEELIAMMQNFSS